MADSPIEHVGMAGLAVAVLGCGVAWTARDTRHVLGLDCSTQSLKLCLVKVSSKKVVYQTSVHFDDDLPQYKTRDGVLRDAGNGLHVTSPSLMFVEALDIALARLKQSGYSMQSIIAISGSGQQHGTIYWMKGALSLLQHLDPQITLREQLKDAFGVSNGPIWMDSSTTAQCHKLEQALGGAQQVADRTGSRAYERFSGNQIAKVLGEDPSLWSELERISLVSSFMASLFIGYYAPIDRSDGSGMNLMNMDTCLWDDDCLDALVQIAGAGSRDALLQLLGPHPVASSEVIGDISPYFVDRYGFRQDCHIVAFSGDNPCSLAGMRLCNPGDVAISLGTSSTVLAALETPQPGLEGHIMRNPIDRDTYMAMLCFKNGALARKHVRKSVGCSSWKEFNELVMTSPPGNEGKLGFYYFDSEITPTLNQTGVVRFDASDAIIDCHWKPDVEARAVLESQFLSLRSHAEQMGIQATRVIATGGASNNRVILQMLANIFQCSVCVSSVGSETAAVGAAYRALHAFQSIYRGTPFSSVISGQFKTIAIPDPNTSPIYDTALLERFRFLETKAASFLE